MRIKALTLHGFKSFPDKTVLNFENGITAVVGPNGSGKSNLSDAIRWVLGETSAKSVRGVKMEDVIFSGTNNRRAMAYAEVSLTIDNTDEDTKLALDYDEVTVTRRCYRSGESEYLINGKTVRQRDVTELFLNTGMGKTGYSMIGQGKIAEIISQKSEERRKIFEEAAGISKYRFKKNEAERKMQAVEDNLVRLTDICQELGSRVGPLERESNKAKQYLEYFAEKKKLDIALWLFDIDRVRVTLHDCEDKFSIAKHGLEMADDTLAALETQNEKGFAASQENKMNADRTADQIKAVSEESFALEGQLRLRENDIGHYRELITRAENEISERNGALGVHQESLEELDWNCGEMRTELAQLEQEGQDADAAMQVRFGRRAELENRQTANRTAYQNEQNRMTESRIRLSALEADGQNTASRREELEERLNEAQSNARMLEERIGQADNTMREYAQRGEELRGQIAAIDAKTGEARRQLDELREACNRIEVSVSSRKQRIDALQRMEELFEGYSQSVRRVMQAAERREIAGVCGPVSRIITVKPKYSIAMETALGASLQNIVVESEDAAKAAIRYLKDNNAGRATFYPLTSIRPTPARVGEQTLRGYQGYLGMASDLVEFDARFRNVVVYLLGHTAVFDTLDHATAMARGTGFGLRAVTLDGQIINAGGSFTGGSVRRDSGMLTRSAEIEKIRGEVEALKKEAEQKKKESETWEAQVAESAGEKEMLAAQTELLQSLYHAEDTQKQVLLSQKESDEKQTAVLIAALEGLETTGQENMREIASLQEYLNRVGEEQTARQQEFDALEKERTALANEINRAGQAQTALQLRTAELRKDLEAAERTRALTQEAIAGVAVQIGRAKASIDENRELIRRAEEEINASKQKMELTGEEIKRLEAAQEELRAAALRQDQAMTALREKIRQQSHDREILFREYTRLESQLSQISAEQDKLISKLWEEYELTVSAAHEAGYAPIAESERTATVARQTEYRNKIRALGSVNTNAIEEYREVKERYDFMNGQINDLTTSREELHTVIFQLEKEMRERFVSTMDQLNRTFKRVFRELFGGGNAELIIDDPENVLESGITINVAPPGKIINNLSLLSGGEQSFVATALLYAILEVNPTPFCMLDEVEAALDDVNVARFAEYARRFSHKTQFIIITHRRGTMERADTIYGVTMPERGISRVLTLNVNEVEAKLGIKLNGGKES